MNFLRNFANLSMMSPCHCHLILLAPVHIIVIIITFAFKEFSTTETNFLRSLWRRRLSTCLRRDCITSSRNCPTEKLMLTTSINNR